MPRRYLKALALPSLLLIGLAGGAQSLQAPASKEAQGPFQISVNVDLVVLNATVRDSKGRFAPDLREQDFAVYEDGVRQSISLFRHEDIPVTVGLVVDHSSSMTPKPTKWLQFVPSTPDQIQYRDINGDGLADAIYADLAGTKGIWVSYSNGPSFSIPVLLMDLH
jgi:hypothetical protein